VPGSRTGSTGQIALRITRSVADLGNWTESGNSTSKLLEGERVDVKPWEEARGEDCEKRSDLGSRWRLLYPGPRSQQVAERGLQMPSLAGSTERFRARVGAGVGATDCCWTNRARNQPVAELDFADAELKLSCTTENGGHDEITIPRDRFRHSPAPIVDNRITMNYSSR
jgi:hypothetical protein